MIKIISLVLAVLLSATAASAQDLKQKLNLTPEQTPKVEAIDSTFKKGIATLRNSGESKLSKYKKLKSLRNEKDKQMKAVLTKEQFKIYKEYQQEKKEELKARRQNRIEP